jgi:hypothetical protein
MHIYSLISSFGSSYFTVFKWVHMLAVVDVFVKVLFTLFLPEGIQGCRTL